MDVLPIVIPDGASGCVYERDCGCPAVQAFSVVFGFVEGDEGHRPAPVLGNLDTKFGSRPVHDRAEGFVFFNDELELQPVPIRPLPLPLEEVIPGRRKGV